MSGSPDIFAMLDQAMTAAGIAPETPVASPTAIRQAPLAGGERLPLPIDKWRRGLPDVKTAWQAAQELKPQYRVVWGKEAGGYYVAAPGYQPEPAPAAAPIGEPDSLASVYDVLRFCGPPYELIELLQQQEQRAQLPPAVAAFLRKWERIPTDLPVPALDTFQLVGGDQVAIADPVPVDW